MVTVSFDAGRYVEYYLGNAPSLSTLLVANGAAFLVGVSFYVHSDPSFADLPTFLYPLFGDSPTALALVTLSLATLLPHLGNPVRDAPTNVPLAYLHTFAFVWLIKYGLWTVVALNLHPDQYVGFGGAALWDYWGIMLTHLLFVVEAFAIPYYGRTTDRALKAALVALLVNDVFDYGLGYYPPLRYEPGIPLILATLVLSVGTVYIADRVFDRMDRFDPLAPAGGEDR
ncbi:DUF1405 domain-containing protein [Haloplanus aerogenes]|uniref:DUF1405 domain-containing protein n=1 Tax=Haloplanus aerogenes TaxID=660522 RepID=A0A3M0CYM1_9EURY|nr:DUF1405 domain-containing protein [Haloplanus aerogenes]AZH26508.1 DUF1405 domain-containing protein [Haloplanus aerogenes]RMB12736.1 putative membrane protein YpjA [Haloplanus aerogenes]